MVCLDGGWVLVGLRLFACRLYCGFGLLTFDFLAFVCCGTGLLVVGACCVGVSVDGRELIFYGFVSVEWVVCLVWRLGLALVVYLVLLFVACDGCCFGRVWW